MTVSARHAVDGGLGAPSEVGGIPVKLAVAWWCAGLADRLSFTVADGADPGLSGRFDLKSHLGKRLHRHLPVDGWRFRPRLRRLRRWSACSVSRHTQ